MIIRTRCRALARLAASQRHGGARWTGRGYISEHPVGLNRDPLFIVRGIPDAFGRRANGRRWRDGSHYCRRPSVNPFLDSGILMYPNADGRGNYLHRSNNQTWPVVQASRV